MKAANLTSAPHYLKMDIEGFEYSVIRSILRSKTMMPDQIALEIHYRTSPGDKAPSSVLNWSNRRKDLGEILAFVLMFISSGYRLTHVMQRSVLTVWKYYLVKFIARLNAVV